MKKALLVALSCSVAVVALVAGILFVRPMSAKEGFSNERAYRNSVDHDLVFYDFEDNVAKDPTVQGDYEKLRSATFEAFTILNTERAAQNHKPLEWSYPLSECAQVRSEEIAYTFENGHTRPNGEVWYTLNSEEMLGENIYKGKLDADKVMATWMKNEADDMNFMSDTFTKTAICVYENNGTYYWVATFGSDLTDITFENDVQPGQVWILKDTEINRHTSVWGTAMIDADEPGKEYHPGIPKSDDDKYLFRMIDTDGIYYEADIPELQNNWKIKVFSKDNDTSIHLQIYNENDGLVNDCEVFNAAL